jgi:hypothetical protein
VSRKVRCKSISTRKTSIVVAIRADAKFRQLAHYENI